MNGTQYCNNKGTEEPKGLRYHMFGLLDNWTAGLLDCNSKFKIHNSQFTIYNLNIIIIFFFQKSLKKAKID